MSLARGVSFLLATGNPDGGWPYLPGQTSAPEPTCLAAMAISRFPGTKERINEALRWISGVAFARTKPDTVWPKSLFLLACVRLNGPVAVQNRLSEYLLHTDGARAKVDPAIRLDGNVRGWPWVSGTFSWVEPTSYALLALKSAGHREPPRVKEGERMLLDRVCADGGWNYGNPQVYGSDLTSMATATSLAALALHGVAAADAITGRALDLLDNDTQEHPSTLGLALASLALNAYRRPQDRQIQGLLGRQLEDGSWRNQIHLSATAALAVAAAEGRGNLFEVSDAQT